MQDQHALVVDGAGHIDLALDVEQALLPGKGARGDAHRKAEAVVAQVDLRHGVDLAGDGACQRDQALALGDGVVQFFFRLVVALGAGGQGGLHIGGLHQRAAARLAQGGAFNGQRFGVRKACALAALVVGLAVGLLQHQGHGVGAEVGQAALFADLRHQDGGGVVGGGGGGKVV
ncbi:hypothetical protein D3C71_1432100 [compost metagenome]